MGIIYIVWINVEDYHEYIMCTHKKVALYKSLSCQTKSLSCISKRNIALKTVYFIHLLTFRCYSIAVIRMITCMCVTYK